jgi:hypothetical protein
MNTVILGDKVVSVLLQCANALLLHNDDDKHTQLINQALQIANDIDRGEQL